MNENFLLQVEFHHMGTYKLKGVTGSQTVMQINSIAFTEREFPKRAASGKAEMVVHSMIQPLVSTTEMIIQPIALRSLNLSQWLLLIAEQLVLLNKKDIDSPFSPRNTG